MSNICKGCGGFIMSDEIYCYYCDNQPTIDDIIRNKEESIGGDYEY